MLTLYSKQFQCESYNTEIVSLYWKYCELNQKILFSNIGTIGAKFNHANVRNYVMLA